MRFLISIIASVFLVLGLILWILPLPFGLILTCLSLMVLLAVSPRAARWMRGLRRRFAIFDQGMTGLTRRLPMPYRRILRQTEVSRW